MTALQKTARRLMILIALAVVAPSARAADRTKLDELQNAFIQVAEKVRPSVVNISAETRLRRGANPLDLLPIPPGGGGTGRQRRPPISTGSGIVIRADGYILTNYHVVRGGDVVRVLFDVDSDAPDVQLARIVGFDAESDLAVLRVNKTGLKPLPLVDSDKVKVGSWVVAVGSPFGQSGTVTCGIISAHGRHVLLENGEISLIEYIQTDAAINPGNSGGPLCDLDGNVLGINTVILTRTGANSGIAFASTSNTVRDVLPFLLKGERVPRGFLGVSYRPIAPEVAKGLGIDRGLVVSDFAPGESPAKAAGLQTGDILVELNGKKVTTSDDFRAQVVRLGPGAQARVKTLREIDGEMKSVNATITLGQRPPRPDEEEEDKANGAPPPQEPILFGMTVENNSAENTRRFRLPPAIASQPGALVTAVEPFSAAYDAVLQPGDLVTKVKVNNEKWREVKSAEDFKSLIGKPKPGDRVLIMGRFRLDGGQTAVDFRALVMPQPVAVK